LLQRGYPLGTLARARACTFALPLLLAALLQLLLWGLARFGLQAVWRYALSQSCLTLLLLLLLLCVCSFPFSLLFACLRISSSSSSSSCRPLLLPVRKLQHALLPWLYFIPLLLLPCLKACCHF
jgi:hypothetical protein